MKRKHTVTFFIVVLLLAVTSASLAQHGRTRPRTRPPGPRLGPR